MNNTIDKLNLFHHSEYELAENALKTRIQGCDLTIMNTLFY